MHFFKSVVSGALLLAATVAAQVKFVSAPSNVEQGTPVTFTWTGATGPVTINLMEGPSNHLTQVMTVVSSATGTSYTWTAPANLVSNTDYAWQITDGTTTNYWGDVVLNASLEPGQTSIITTPVPVTPAPTVVPTPVPTTTVVPPIITPPANTTIPPPISAGVVPSSFSIIPLATIATIIGACALFL